MAQREAPPPPGWLSGPPVAAGRGGAGGRPRPPASDPCRIPAAARDAAGAGARPQGRLRGRAGVPGVTGEERSWPAAGGQPGRGPRHTGEELFVPSAPFSGTAREGAR